LGYNPWEQRGHGFTTKNLMEGLFIWGFGVLAPVSGAIGDFALVF
jgi:hypothetical protein